MVKGQSSAVAVGQSPIDKPMHKCGETGQYGTLCNDGKAYTKDKKKVWERDHIPAKAQLYARLKKMYPTKRKATLKCARGKLKYRGKAICIPRSAHVAASPTHGGNNTPKQIKDDAASAKAMQAGKQRDVDDMVAHLRKARPDCVDAYLLAAKEVLEFDVDKMIDECVAECLAGK